MASLVTEAERQKAFGLNFTLINLGIGAGGLVAGTFVDVHRPQTFLVIYLCDAVTNLIPFAILLSLGNVGGRVAPASGSAAPAPSGGYAAVLRDRTFVRYFVFLLVVTVCGYAQIEVGFTAFSVEVANVEPRVLGWAFAGNTTLIVLAQLFVLRWLDGRSRSRALAVAASVFAASWVILAVAGLSFAGTAFATVGVVACGVVFGMGETLLSPVMPAITNALAAGRAARPLQRARLDGVRAGQHRRAGHGRTAHRGRPGRDLGRHGRGRFAGRRAAGAQPAPPPHGGPGRPHRHHAGPGHRRGAGARPGTRTRLTAHPSAPIMKLTS